jgi:hypothetical protein
MDLIGQSVLWDSAKPVRDAAAALIFPAIEPGIPKTLDDALDQYRSGDWDHQVLTTLRVFRLELLQASQPHRSFQETLREVWQVWRRAGLVKGAIPTSSALSQARARLPIWALEALFRHSTGVAQSWPAHPLCPEHRLRVIDGVPLVLPRTAPNLKAFGTTRSGRGPGYYPQAMAVWISHVPGYVVMAEHLGPVCEGDQAPAPGMLDRCIEAGDLVLGDGHFGTYPCCSVIQRRGAFHLVRASGTFLPQKHRIGPGAPDDADLLVTPTRAILCEYRDWALPEALPMRAVTLDIPARDELNRTEPAVFLTNLPRQAFSRQRLATLTPLRWGAETLHNDVKTRLGLGEVRSLHPPGVKREVLAHLGLSNLLRRFLAQANPAAPWQGSFTAARSALIQANHQLRWKPDQQERTLHVLAEMICSQPLNMRPGRSEPRRKRPDRRPYSTFTTPRADWRAARKAG